MYLVRGNGLVLTVLTSLTRYALVDRVDTKLQDVLTSYSFIKQTFAFNAAFQVLGIDQSTKYKHHWPCGAYFLVGQESDKHNK